jgi:hypothetical protein
LPDLFSSGWLIEQRNLQTKKFPCLPGDQAKQQFVPKSIVAGGDTMNPISASIWVQPDVLALSVDRHATVSRLYSGLAPNTQHFASMIPFVPSNRIIAGNIGGQKMTLASDQR